MIVLRPCSELCRCLLTVVFDNVWEEVCVCKSVRNVELTAELMSEGVVYTEECVCECHTCDTGSIVHLLSCKLISCLVGIREILKYELDSVECESVCIVCCKNGNISFDSVCENVKSCECCGSLRNCVNELRVNDSDIRSELVVSERILHVLGLIGNYCEGSNFRTCTGSCRYADKLSLLTHLRELVNSLTDIHELLSHADEVSIGVLIEEPHCLCSVHCGTAADSNDAVRLEGVHNTCTLTNCCKVRIRLNFAEDLDNGVIFVLIELICESVNIAELNHSGVSYDHNSVDLRHLSKVLNSARFEVDLFRNLEPLHVKSSLSDLLNVDEVLSCNVLGNGVLTVRTAAECKGRSHGVVNVTDSTEGCRRINNDTACIHGFAVEVSEFIIRCVDNCCMTCTVLEHFLTKLESVLVCIRLNNCEYRRKLFECERILVSVCAADLNAEYLCFLRNCDACLFSDLPRILTNDPRTYSHLFCVDNCILDLLNFFRLCKIAAVILHEANSLIIDLLVDDSSLLRCADHTVIEGLGKNEVVNSLLNVCRLFDIARCVTRANAECRLTCGISSLNHSRTACCEDSCNVLTL